MCYNESSITELQPKEDRVPMPNVYLTHLQKIEFVITYACTGRCIHCSEGDHLSCGDHIAPTIASDAVRKIAGTYPIKTVMTFGGEPLLYPDAVCEIHTAAKKMGVPKRQIITNGFFTKDHARMKETVKALARCGVNDILLSVDAFHQKTIPLEWVKSFAAEVQKQAIPLRLQPAWLVSREDDNPYNLETRAILDSFSCMDIPVGAGNIIFPAGNAAKYLAEYFLDHSPVNPYVEDPTDVRCVSFDPTGDVLGRNVYRQDIMEILQNYDPTRNN